MTSLSVRMTSHLLSMTTIGTPSKLALMFSRSFVCFPMSYPHVSEGSRMKIMMSVRYLSARTACFSMSFLSSKSRSRSPGVSTIWNILQSSLMCPMVIPFVVNG